MSELDAAADTSTSPADLGRLASHLSWDVRRLVAANPSTPPEVLQRLAGSRDAHAVRAIAGNPSALSSLLDAWVVHDDRVVREAVASNEVTSSPSLSLLTADAVPAVRVAASEALRARGEASLISPWHR